MAAAPDASADLTMYSGNLYLSDTDVYGPGDTVYLELNDTDINTSTSAETYTLGVASGTEPNVTVSGESVPSGTTTYTTARIVADNDTDGSLNATDFTLTATSVQIDSVVRERNGTATLTFNASTSGSETIDYVSFDETVQLTETGGESASFTGSISTGTGAASASDGTLQVATTDNVTVYYPDLSATTRRVTTAYIDGEPPTVTDEETINNTYVREDSIRTETFLFRFNDSEAGINIGKTNVTLRYNGSERTFDATGSDATYNSDVNGNEYNVTIDPSDDWSSYTEFSRNPQDGDVIWFNVSSTDTMDNTVDTDNFAFLTVDGSAPFFTQRTPAPESMTNNNQPSITVNITDSDAGVNASSLTVTLTDSTGYTYLDGVGTGDSHVSWNGDVLTIDPTAATAFTLNETLAEVNVTATDDVSHRNETVWNFTVDSTNPTSLTLHAPTSTLDVTANEDIDVTYSYNETNPDITNITFYDGSGNNVTYTVDDAGYAGDETEKTATIDLNSPDGTTGSGLVHDTTYSLAILTADEAGNTDNVYNAASNILELSNIQLDSDFYTQGDTMTITVFDNSSSGNNAPGSVEYVDITANTTGTVTTETVTVEAANNASRGSGEDLRETGPNTGVFTGSIDLVAPANDGDTSNGKLGVETADTVNVYTPNFAGSATATVDQAAPTGTTINTPANTVYHTTLPAGNSTMTVNYTYTETGGGAQNVTFTLIGGNGPHEFDDSSVPGGTGTITTTGVVNLTGESVDAGTYDLKVTVTDGGGNSNSTTVQDRVVVDNTQPTVTLRSVQNTFNASGSLYTKTTSASRTLEATISDDGNLTSGLSFTLNYNVSGTSGSAAMSNSSVLGNTSANYTADIDDTTGLGAGETVTAWVTGGDRANLPPDLSFSTPLTEYTLDSNRPTISSFTVSGGSCSVDLSMSATDTTSGVKNFDIYRHNSTESTFTKIDTVSASSGSATYIDNGAPSGTHTYKVAARDHVNRVRESSEKTTSVSLGNLSLSASTSFNSVNGTASPDLSNRTVTVTVSDDCSVGSSGNLITSEQVNFSVNTTDLTNVTLEPTTSTTDANGQTSFSMTAQVAEGWVNISGWTMPGSTNLTDTLSIYLERHTISLKDGWNMVSTPIIPSDADIEQVLTGVEGSTIEQVWYYNTTQDDWRIYNPDKSSNQLTTFEADKGYFVNVSGDGNLTVTGALKETQTSPATPPELTLHAGWNLVGFRRYMDTSYYFGNFSISNAYTLNVQGGSSISYGAGVSASGTKLGRGYWVDINSETTVPLADLR